MDIQTTESSSCVILPTLIHPLHLDLRLADPRIKGLETPHSGRGQAQVHAAQCDRACDTPIGIISTTWHGYASQQEQQQQQLAAGDVSSGTSSGSDPQQKRPHAGAQECGTTGIACW